jgi:hypothetical protein
VLLRGILEGFNTGVFLTGDGPPESDRLRFLGILMGEIWPSGLNGTFETMVFANRGNFGCGRRGVVNFLRAAGFDEVMTKSGVLMLC